MWRKGNGAREKVLQYFYVRDGQGGRTAAQVDHFLAWLYLEGYTIVPNSEPKPVIKKRRG